MSCSLHSFLSLLSLLFLSLLFLSLLSLHSLLSLRYKFCKVYKLDVDGIYKEAI